MTYTFSKTVSCSWIEALDRTNAALANNGFGVLTSIDVAATMKKKLDKDMPAYTILGACNPHLAAQAIEHEPHIGVFLPCNVILRQLESKLIEISAVNAEKSMMAIENADLGSIAGKVNGLLAKVIEEL